MFRSIRWTLQMWHAAILATVLVAFGWVVCELLRLTEYKRIDEDLTRVSTRVLASLRPVAPLNGPRLGPRGLVGTDFQNLAAALNSGKLSVAQQAFAQLQKDVQAQQGPGRRLSRDRSRSSDGRAGDSATPDTAGAKKTVSKEAASKEAVEEASRELIVPPLWPTGNPLTAPPSPPPASPPGSASAAPPSNPTETGNGPDFLRDGRGRGREMRAELGPDLKSLFEEENETPYYFVLWRADGGIVSKSKFAPDDIVLPAVLGGRREQFVRQRGDFREAVRQRLGTNVLVGRSIESDVAALHEKEWLVALVGIGVLVGGLLGGHWFSRRAIRPIEAISATAAEISLSNLSRRIDVTGTETELTGLARTLNQMFDRIESAFSQQVRFTADASHELRTPVAVILSHAELALDKQRPAEELRETIETCRRSAVRMKSLIESLLTLARFDSGELQLDSRPFDLARTAGDCIALVRPLAAQRRIAIHMDLPPASTTGDPDRIAQVITNLLTNAIRYNHDQGQVVVATQSLPNEVILSVSDTGIGISQEHLANIFERFYRVDKARSRKDGGVGLGLAICKSIVMAHGGQISVSSQPDRGTKFEVRLPKAGVRVHSMEDVRKDSEERRSDVVTAGAFS